MPQTIKIITPEYAKSHYGFVIDNTLPFNTMMTSMKSRLQDLIETPDEIEVPEDPEQGFTVDLAPGDLLDPIIQPNRQPFDDILRDPLDEAFNQVD
jgi:hypothetical protein